MCACVPGAMATEFFPQWIKRTDARHKCPVEDPDYHKEELFFRDLVRLALLKRLSLCGSHSLCGYLLCSLPVQTGEDSWNKPQCCVCDKKIEEASYECCCCKVRAREPGPQVPRTLQYNNCRVVPNARLTPPRHGTVLVEELGQGRVHRLCGCDRGRERHKGAAGRESGACLLRREGHHHLGR